MSGPHTAGLQERGETRVQVRHEAGAGPAAGGCRYRPPDVDVAGGRVPRLQDALRDLNARLEEAERAELVRLRWAADHPTEPSQAVGP